MAASVRTAPAGRNAPAGRTAPAGQTAPAGHGAPGLIVATRVVAALLVAVSIAACQGATRESLAAGYTALAAAANAASTPLLDSLASTDGAARAPILRGLADVEETFADGLAALPTSGDVRAAADEVVRLARQREDAFRTAAAVAGPAQAAALAPIMGQGGAAFHAAVEKLRATLGLPPTDASPSPSARAGHGLLWGPAHDASAARPTSAGAGCAAPVGAIGAAPVGSVGTVGTTATAATRSRA